MQPRTLCLLLFSLLLLQAGAQSGNKDFAIIDLSQQQMRLFEQYKDADSATRARVFVDSLYQPYQDFWSGYLGSADDFAGWVSEKVLPRLPEYQQRNMAIDGSLLLRRFDSVKARMERLTGYRPKGKWYIVYGPAWADLGGLSGGTMFVDLSHRNNGANDAVTMMFPHELTHQIFSNVNKAHDTTALNSIINEGFAVYMNQLFWKDKYTLAQNLAYTEAEMAAIALNKEAIQQFFLANYNSTDKQVVRQFRDRGVHLKPGLPGAIGYYIGYQIVDRYVQKFGAGAWKDVFTKAPREILRLSGYPG